MQARCLLFEFQRRRYRAEDPSVGRNDFLGRLLRLGLAGNAPLTRLETFLTETFRLYVEVHGETGEPIQPGVHPDRIPGRTTPRPRRA